MRKFLTIFSFCFIFTISYTFNVFASDYPIHVPNEFYYVTWSQFNGNFNQSYGLGSHHGSVVLVHAPDSQAVLLTFTDDGSVPFCNISGRETAESASWDVVRDSSNYAVNFFSRGGLTLKYVYTYLANYRTGGTYYTNVTDFSILVPNMSFSAESVVSYFAGVGDLPSGSFDESVYDPEESSLLDFKDITTNIGSPYKVKEVSFLTKLGDFFGSGLSGKIPQYNDSFYNLPNIDIVWSSPASLVGGDDVGITFTLSGEISFYRVNDANRVGLPLNYTLVLADKDISLNAGFSTYQAKFDSILTDYIIQNKAIFEDSSGQSFSDLYRYFRLENKVRYIGLQAFADINGVPSKGAPSTIDFSSGSPVVKYGVTVEDVLPDGNYSVDSNNDYSGTVSGDTIIYNTEGSTTYIYNYITNNNYPASSVTSSNVVDGLGVVNTMLRNVPGMLQTALSGTDDPSSGVKLVISFLTVALGVALALRFFGIFFK